MVHYIAPLICQLIAEGFLHSEEDKPFVCNCISHVVFCFDSSDWADWARCKSALALARVDRQGPLSVVPFTVTWTLNPLPCGNTLPNSDGADLLPFGGILAT